MTYHHEGPARAFTRERAALRAIKEGAVEVDGVMVLVSVGPAGTGMEETYRSPLRSSTCLYRVALVTDARFSGVSTGACTAHVGPEGSAGGPLGKVLEKDTFCTATDSSRSSGTLDLVGEMSDTHFSTDEGARRLQERQSRAFA